MVFIRHIFYLVSFRPHLISDNLAPSCEWEVLNKLNSGHLPVITKFNINNQWKNKNLFIPKWNLKKAHWSNFKEECNNINVDNIKNNNIDIFNDNLFKTITDIADKYIPKTNKPSTHKSVPWWNNTLQKLIINRNKSRKQLQKNKIN